MRRVRTAFLPVPWVGVCVLLAAAAAHAGEALVADAYRLEVPDGYTLVQDVAVRSAASAHASTLCAAAGYQVSSSGAVSSYAKGDPGAPASLVVAVRLAAKGPIASVAAIPPEWLAEVSRRATGVEGSTARKMLVGTRGAVPAVEVQGSFDRGDHNPNPARTLIVPRREFVLVLTLEGLGAVGSADVEPPDSPWARVLDSLEVHAPAPAQSVGGAPFPFAVAAVVGGVLLLLGIVFLASRRRDRVVVPAPPPAPASASGSTGSAPGSIRAADGLPTYDRPAPPPPARPKPAATRPATPAKPSAKPAAPSKPRITGNSPVVEGAPAASVPARTVKISRNTDFLSG